MKIYRKIENDSKDFKKRGRIDKISLCPPAGGLRLRALVAKNSATKTPRHQVTLNQSIVFSIAQRANIY